MFEPNGDPDRNSALPPQMSTVEADLEMLGKIVQGHLDCRNITPEALTRIAQLAIVHGMGPLLFVAMREQDSLGLLPRSAVHLLFVSYGQSHGFNQRAYAAVEEWCERFADANITAIWLKGVALGLTVYPDRATRVMTDVDVLTPPGQIAVAMDLLEVVTGARPARLGEHNGKDAVAMIGQHKGGAIHLELHWSLLEAPSSPVAPDLAWFWTQTMTIDFGGHPLTILRPEAHLLYLCAHALLQHGEAASNLLRYYDLHRLIVTTPGFDWALLLGKAIDFGWTDIVERGLVLSQKYFGTAIPVGLLAQLDDQRSAARFTAVVERRRRPLTRWTGTISRLGTMNWPARVGLAWGLIFPPLTYIRYRYHLQNNWQALLHYPYRWWDAAGEVFGWSKAAKQRRRT